MKKILFLLTMFIFANAKSQDTCINDARIYTNTNITANGVRAITGAKLNTSLNKIIDAIDCVGGGVFVATDSNTVINYNVLNSQNAPPVSPIAGDTYLVGTVPTGAWVGHPKDVAEWNGSAWVFTDGIQGDFLYNATTALTYIFRSGNWVQTTGIPILNNGNTISTGVRLGTNNLKSLTFETNNVARGRIDSIGRFYFYDTSLRNSNKFLQIDSATGRLIASAISANSGTSALFPNGLAIIEASRDFQASDEGKLLVLFPNVNLTMPDSIIFSGSLKTIGILQLDNTSWFEQEFGGTKIKSLTTAEFKHNEIVLCLTSVTDDDSASRLLFLSTTIIEEQTALKYLYDKSQNAILLSGTASGSPVTGNIQIDNNQTIYSYGSDNTSYGSFGVEDDKLIISYNTANQSTLTINENGFKADCANLTSKGLFSSNNFYENAKNDNNAFAQYGGVRDIIGNLRFTISKSVSASDADFNAAPGTAYMLSEVADNDKVITLTSPVDGDIYRFNNVTQPTNNWITNVTIFLSDGTTSNVVPASKITIIQYDAAASVFHLISSQ